MPPSAPAGRAARRRRRLDAEDGVGLALDRLAERRGRPGQDRVEVLAVQLAPAAEQIARGAVRVDDAQRFVAQDDRHRGRLQHGLEEDLALVAIAVLGAQHLAQLVEPPHQIAQRFVGARHGQAHAVLALGEAEQAVGDRLRGSTWPGR